MSELAEDRRIEADPVPDEAFVAVPERLRRRAAKGGDALALRCGDDRLSWAELGDQVERGAALLRQAGVGPGDIVAILADTSVDYVIAFLAGLSAGACVAPLPSGASDATLVLMAADASAVAFFASENMRGRADAILAEAALASSARRFLLDGDAEDAGWLNFSRRSAAVEHLPEPVQIQPDWGFNIIYSSGTTGVPKGIVHDHRLRARQLARFSGKGLGPGKSAAAATALYSNTTLITLFGALCAGAAMLLKPKFEVEGFMELIAEHQASHAMMVPVIIQRMLAHPRFDEIDLTSLEVTFCTSSVLPLHVKEDALARWPGTIFEIYGLTEGGVGAGLDIRENPDKIASVGQPLLGAEMLVVDDDGRPLPTGEVGEVIGRSQAMMVGYFKRPDLTREAMIQLPDGRWFFRSGDLGRFDEEGFLYLAGRKKDMIISGGFNIYATDLEDALFAHEAVAEAAVVGGPSAEWGETPVAFVVLTNGASIEAETLRRFANDRLGKIQRISEIRFVDSLPRNAIGKVMKRDLAAALVDGAERDA